MPPSYRARAVRIEYALVVRPVARLDKPLSGAVIAGLLEVVGDGVGVRVIGLKECFGDLGVE